MEMQAMVLDAPRRSLRAATLPVPAPGPGQLQLRVEACAVCRTDLHIVDGELPHPKPRLVPGHEIVGRVTAIGTDVHGHAIGDRVGVPWLGWTCGVCEFCRTERENLCPSAKFTGYDLDGGYAEFTVADARYATPLPAGVDALQAAPLLCAGLIGFRSWRIACEGREVRNLGLYGFGAAAHLLAQLAVHEGQQVFAFTRDGDMAAQHLARQLGCAWAGGSGEAAPGELDAAIIFAPIGGLVPTALKAVRKGGIVVCGGIHMSDIPAFPYALLWEERSIVSVANLTRDDARDYLPRAAAAGVTAHVTTYPLAQANAALDDLRAGRLTGAAVLVP